MSEIDTGGKVPRIVRREPVEAMIEACESYIDEQHHFIKDDAMCDHESNVCWCDYWRSYVRAKDTINAMRDLLGFRREQPAGEKE